MPNGGDMRGGLWFRVPAPGQPSDVQGIREKRLKGFEPSTFCMAIRPGSEPSWQ